MIEVEEGFDDFTKDYLEDILELMEDVANSHSLSIMETSIEDEDGNEIPI